MNRKTCILISIASACLAFAGCKSEPKLRGGNKAAAAETSADSPVQKTVVRSIKTGHATKRTAASAAPAPGTARTSRDAAATTESNVLVHGKVTLPDGSPAAGVLVGLYGFDAIDLMQGRYTDAKPLTTATVDEKGQYEVSSKNTMGLHMRVTGNVPAMLVHLDHQSLHDGQKLKVTPIKIRKDITTVPGFKVAGAVVDDNGKQLPGLPVYMRPKPQPNSNLIGMNTDTTSTAAGAFELANIAAGTWLIGSAHPDYAPIAEEIAVPTSGPVTLQFGLRGGTVTGHVIHKDTGAAASGLPVKLFRSDIYSMLGDVEKYETQSAADGSFRFDHVSSGPKRLVVDTGNNPKLGMVYPGPTMSVGEKETTDVVAFVYPGHTITGRVYDKDTQDPLPGAKVTFNRSWLQASDSPEAISDAEGNYRLEHVFNQTGSSMNLTAALEGFAPAMDNPHSDRYTSLPPDTTEITKDFPMVKTVRISGRVVTRDEVPVPHAEVALYDNKNHSRTDQRTIVNSDGTFELESVPFVSAVIEANAKGYGRVVTDTIDISTQDVEGLKIVMDVGAVVTGRVLTPEGKPVSGATVQENKQYNIFSTYREVAVSGEDGLYRIADAPKDLHLKAKKDGFAESEVLELALQPGESREDADLALRQGFVIAGKVVTANRAPAQNAHISARGATYDWFSDNADTDGKFEIKDMPDGTYSVSVSSRYGSKEVQGIKAGTKDLEIVLGGDEKRNTVKFIGTVVDDATGDPIRDYTVKTNNSIQIKKLTEPGKFELLGVEVRYGYYLTISSPGYMEQKFNTDSSNAGEDVDQTFRLGKGGAITGRLVERGTGKPVPNVPVINWGTAEHHERYQASPKNHTTSDEDGRFTLAPAPSGKNFIHIKPAAPYAEVAPSIDVKSEQVADLGDIELGNGGTIRGVVVRGADEQPVSGHKVSISAYSEELRVSRSTSTNDQGQFEFTGLPPMQYEVQASGPEKNVKLEAGQTADIKLVIGGVTVKGTVYRGTTPIRANISANDGPGGQHYGHFTESGEYELQNVMPGTYRFSVHPQISDSIEETVEIPDQAEFEKDFQFPDCSLTVLVVDAAGQPVPRASVSLARSGDAPGPNQGWQGQRQETSHSDTDGHAKFEMLKPGSYSLTGQKEDVGTGVLPAVQVNDGDHPEVRLELNTGGGTLESVALSYATGQGVPEAWCYLYGENGQFGHAAKRDAAGLMVIKNIPPGTYRTNVSYWSHSMSEKQVEIKAGETVRIEDVLYPAGVIRWRLMKADGSGAGGADVTVTPVAVDPPEQPKNGKTGPEGWFVLRGLAPGTYQATAQWSGKPAITETFTVTAGAEAKKEITVPGW